LPQGCSCPEEGRWCHGFHAATTDLERIERCWGGGGSDFGVGVSCGPSRLVVLDVDAHVSEPPDRSRLLPGIAIHPEVDLEGLTSGFDSLALLAAYRRQPNPAEDAGTVRVRTPSGGLHIWYALGTGSPDFRSSTGSGHVALAWQVDIRADNGYVVAPGTRTAAGQYRFVDSTRVPAPLPGWLEKELLRTGHGPAQVIPSAESTLPRQQSPRSVRMTPARMLGSLLEDVHACAGTPRGVGFTEKLNRAAYTAGGLVAARRLSEAEAMELLTEAAHKARPGQERRNLKIISDSLAAGARRPLHAKGLR
jgi:hypothetical protein